MNSARMEASSRSQLGSPRFVTGKPVLMAGLRERFSADTRRQIPELWQRFGPSIGKIPGQVGTVAYGLCLNMLPQPFSFDYMSAVEVFSFADLPEGFTRLSIPELRYAIFPHHGHVSNISKTIDAICHQWLPNSEYAFVHGTPDLPYMMERYGERFDPQTGIGDIEMWIPLKAR